MRGEVMARGLVDFNAWETDVLSMMKDNGQLGVRAAVGKVDGIPDEWLVSLTARCNYLINLAGFMKVKRRDRDLLDKGLGYLTQARDGALTALLDRGWNIADIESTIQEHLSQQRPGDS